MITEDGIKSGLARALVSHPFDSIRIYMQNSKQKITLNSMKVKSMLLKMK